MALDGLHTKGDLKRQIEQWLAEPGVIPPVATLPNPPSSSFFVNPRDYGATGNGSTDDTTSFNATRTAAGVGGHVYVDAGTYVLNDVALNVPHQLWQLAPGAILKLKNSAAGNQCAFLVTADYVTVWGGQFDGNRANNTGSGVGIVRLTGSHERILDGYFHDGQAAGVIVNPGSTIVMDDIQIRGCSFIDCIEQGVNVNRTGSTGTSSGVAVADCFIDNSALGGTAVSTGIQVIGNTTASIHGTVITGCRIKGTTTISGAGGIHGRYVTGLQIDACTVENVDYGITCDDGTVDLTITGTSVIGSTSYGIEFAGVTRGSASGCTVDGNATNATGIALNGVNSDIAISGCTVGNLITGSSAVGISIHDAGTNPQRISIAGCEIYSYDKGILVNGDVVDLSITGNLIAADTAGTTRIGLEVDPNSTALSRWRVSNNTFLDWDTAAINFFFSGSVTLSKVEFQNNTVQNCGAVITSSGVTLDNTCKTENIGTGSVASAATTTLPYFTDTITISGTTNITSVTASYAGRRVTLIFSGVLTFTDGSNLKLAGNFVTTSDDTITLLCDGTNWNETSRSVN